MIVIATIVGGCSGGGGTSVAPSPDAPPIAAADDERADTPTSWENELDPYGPIAFADDAEAGITGTPGETVDCARQLPCRWVDADGAFSVSVSRVDNTAREGRLELHFEIQAMHDTMASVGGARAAAGTSGRSVRAAKAELDEGGTLLAGTRLGGRVEFAEPMLDSTLATWGLMLGDNGSARPATFAGLPVGPVLADAIDCAGALPCTWTDPEGLISVELTGAGGFASERRLHLEWRLVSESAMTLVAGTDTSATGADGTALRARQIRLGGLVVEPGATFDTLPATPQLVRHDFFRVPTAPSILAEVALDVYRDEPVPRWRPRFANVPALAP